jgi:hypothetical protein
MFPSPAEDGIPEKLAAALFTCEAAGAEYEGAGGNPIPKFSWVAEEDDTAKLLDPKATGAVEGIPYEGLGGTGEKEAPTFS